MADTREERIKKSIDDEIYRWQKLVDFYRSEIGIETSLKALMHQREVYYNGLGGFLRAIIGIPESRNYLAKLQAYDEEIHSMQSYHTIMEQSSRNEGGK
ncbi:hypothetical protein COU57_01685 [Candidatus Pacearchaeota archaeon CG10_big_fil_rev_8_21_14_0_10_32_14]|nr:MAG: hypothetical protein COU57_01685 [Candidatus Pacearchaeota archaeon CG10_big_fil_rev_8_21_14_0_10_32_14]